MEMPVILFDMDYKLAVSRLSGELLSRLASVQDERQRLEFYKAAVNRITVYRPTDLVHLSLLLRLVHTDPNREEWVGRVTCSQAAAPRDRVALLLHLQHFKQ